MDPHSETQQEHFLRSSTSIPLSTSERYDLSPLMETRKLQLSGTQNQTASELTLHFTWCCWAAHGLLPTLSWRRAAGTDWKGGSITSFQWSTISSPVKHLQISSCVTYANVPKVKEKGCSFLHKQRAQRPPGVSFLNTRNTIPRRISVPHSEVVCRWGVPAPCPSELTSWDS